LKTSSIEPPVGVKLSASNKFLSPPVSPGEEPLSASSLAILVIPIHENELTFQSKNLA